MFQKQRPSKKNIPATAASRAPLQADSEDEEDEDNEDESEDAESEDEEPEDDGLVYRKVVDATLREWIESQRCRRDVADEYYDNPPRTDRELNNNAALLKLKLFSLSFSAYRYLLRRMSAPTLQ